MIDSVDKLETMLALGQLAKQMFEARQAAFDRSNPYMTETESRVADMLQKVVKEEFDAKVEKNKKDLIGMDIIELRLWAPDAKCALLQLHDYITKEFGIFTTIGLSTGLKMIAADKLFYIAVAVRKITAEEMFGRGDEDK